MRGFFLLLVLALALALAFVLGRGSHAVFGGVLTSSTLTATHHTSPNFRADAGSDFAGNGSAGTVVAGDFNVIIPTSDVTTVERGSPVNAPVDAKQLSVNTVRGYNLRRERDPALLSGRIFMKTPFINPGANKARIYKRHDRVA